MAKEICVLCNSLSCRTVPITFVSPVMASHDVCVLQATARQEALEDAIQQAQTRESQIIEMTQWISDMSSLLQSRLDADILAGDMPKEFEVCLLNYLAVGGKQNVCRTFQHSRQRE